RYHTLHVYTLFFFNDPSTPQLPTLSLHDALPISGKPVPFHVLEDVVPPFSAADPDMQGVLVAMLQHVIREEAQRITCCNIATSTDRKSTRLNSSHVKISYAVFCLKKKK